MPVKYNNGKDIEVAHYEGIKRELIYGCGGYIWDPNPNLGAGREYTEENLYVISVNVPDKLRYDIFMRFYGRLLEYRLLQKCIWIERLGSPARIRTILSKLFLLLYQIYTEKEN